MVKVKERQVTKVIHLHILVDQVEVLLDQQHSQVFSQLNLGILEPMVSETEEVLV